jgi:HD-GYP domain-containing protein (c-di-GMP phosphodiesterase class II)
MTDACAVYHGMRDAQTDFEVNPDAERHAAILWRSADELLGGHTIDDAPAVLIADGALLARFRMLRDVPGHVVIVAADTASASALGKRADIVIAGLNDAVAKTYLLDAACRLAATRLHAARLEQEIARSDDEFDELSRIGMALMDEHDRISLIKLILVQAKRLTESDGAGLLLLAKDERGIPELRPALYDFDSLPGLGLPEISFALDDTSIVGHAGLTKKPVVVADVQGLSSNTSFVGTTDFQRRYKYFARSMLAVPMLTHQDEVLGVLFVANRKSDPRLIINTVEDTGHNVLPYTNREIRLACSLASQAALSIENVRLYQQIEHILESFVRATVSAVEARDLGTAGHSLRVAALTHDLAEAVERTPRGPYRGRRFTRGQLRELHYAALLHDFGKISVREDLLVKAKKLPPVLSERVDSRFDLIYRTIQLEYCMRRVEQCRLNGAEPLIAASLDAQLAEQLRELEQMRAIVSAANEPTVLEESPAVALTDIAGRTFQRPDGSSSPYVTPEELCFLQLPRGTLDDRERAEIELHVDHTQQFLVQIPWTDDLKNLVTYAYGHHEKLNGSGYPRRLTSEEIPIQTRMITLADIFDALTEGDRPYKAAVTPEKAIDIIRSEALAGMLDRDLVDIMTESQVYKRILEEDWHRL